jgi:hypothetical protein
VDGTCTTPHASVGTEMFQGKNIFLIFNFNFNFFFETFQSHRGVSIAVVDDGYAATSVGLKCFKKKN